MRAFINNSLEDVMCLFQIKMVLIDNLLNGINNFDDVIPSLDDCNDDDLNYI